MGALSDEDCEAQRSGVEGLARSLGYAPASNAEPVEWRPRPYTAEECRQLLFDHIRSLVWYWDREERRPSPREKLEGLAFSILSTLDGCSSGVPAIDLIACPHDEDEEYHRENGENWWPESLNLSEGVHLHDAYCLPEREGRTVTPKPIVILPKQDHEAKEAERAELNRRLTRLRTILESEAADPVGLALREMRGWE